MNLNERLKIVRETAGLKQPELAEKLGIPVRTYRSYEHGERDISTSTLKSICEILGVSSDFLLGREQPPLTDNQEHLAKLVADTHPDGLTGAAKVVLGAAINKAKKEAPDRAENPKVKKCAAKLAKMTDAELVEMNNYLNFLIWKRDQSPSED